VNFDVSFFLSAQWESSDDIDYIKWIQAIDDGSAARGMGSFDPEDESSTSNTEDDSVSDRETSSDDDKRSGAAIVSNRFDGLDLSSSE
jgi:hypothetical protein